MTIYKLYYIVQSNHVHRVLRATFEVACYLSNFDASTDFGTLSVTDSVHT